MKICGEEITVPQVIGCVAIAAVLAGGFYLVMAGLFLLA